MNYIKAVIIDDIEDSRDIIRIYLKEHFPNIQVVGEAHSVKSGIDVLYTTNTDLLFLDVRMKDGRGFDILKQLKSPDFNIIFITAHDEYAIEAIKHNAMDYLLKPLDREEFINAVQKFISNPGTTQLKKLDSLLTFLEGRPSDHQIKIPSLSGFTLLNMSDIIYLESDNNYTIIYCVDGSKKLISKTLKEYEHLLPQSNFCRIHNSYIINTQCVIEYIKGRGGSVVMKNKSILKVSQNRKQNLLKHWN